MPRVSAKEKRLARELIANNPGMYYTQALRIVRDQHTKEQEGQADNGD